MKVVGLLVMLVGPSSCGVGGRIWIAIESCICCRVVGGTGFEVEKLFVRHDGCVLGWCGVVAEGENGDLSAFRFAFLVLNVAKVDCAEVKLRPA